MTGVSSPHLNGQSSQSQPSTESKQADSRSDINQLLKETGDYEDEEEEAKDEDEDSDEIEEEIIDEHEVYKTCFTGYFGLRFFFMKLLN